MNTQLKYTTVRHSSVCHAKHVMNYYLLHKKAWHTRQERSKLGNLPFHVAIRCNWVLWHFSTYDDKSTKTLVHFTSKKATDNCLFVIVCTNVCNKRLQEQHLSSYGYVRNTIP